MAGFDPLSQAGNKAKGKRPWFFEDREAERVMNIVMALAQEVSVMQRHPHPRRYRGLRARQG